MHLVYFAWLENSPVIPCALMNTLPFRLSFPFESTDLPRLKMDFHFFDFPEIFLLADNKRLLQHFKDSGAYCFEILIIVAQKTESMSYLLSDKSMTV